MKTRMKMTACPNCGSEARVERGLWSFEECGLKGIVLAGIEIIHCKSCKSSMPIIPNVNGLMSGLARAVISKPYKLTGREVRFLRKHLNMTQDGFARHVKVDKTTVSKWENGDDPVGAQSDILIRYIVLSHDQELRTLVDEAIQKFQEVKDRTKTVKIEIDSDTLRYQYV